MMKRNDIIVLFFDRCIMSSSEELIELVKKLKRERSFVYAEQKHIREQYAQVIKTCFYFTFKLLILFFSAS
jgi:hypothetical protein